MKKLIFSTLALCLLMSSCSNNEYNCRMKNRSFNHIKYFSAGGYPTWISSYSVKVSNADGAAIDISK